MASDVYRDVAYLAAKTAMLEVQIRRLEEQVAEGLKLIQAMDRQQAEADLTLVQDAQDQYRRISRIHDRVMGAIRSDIS